MGFEMTDQPIVRCLHCQVVKKENGSVMREYVNNWWTLRRSMIQLGGKYCAVIEFEVSIKLGEAD
jgi:hypothetical protein